MVHEAVSRVVSNIMPAGLDTMTTLGDTTGRSLRPVSLERDSMVHEAVSRVVSYIMPAGLDTMTTLGDTTGRSIQPVSLKRVDGITKLCQGSEKPTLDG